MISGILGYFIYVNIPLLEPTKPFVNQLVNFLMPAFIFLMLYISFCKVDIEKMRPKRIHLWLLLTQLGTFIILSLPLILFPDLWFRIYLESAMLLIITPTASAAAVVTQKLGGNTNSLITYTVLINLLSAIAIPLVFSLTSINSTFTFIHSFLLILGKVFPLLIIPLILAYLTRRFLPNLNRKINNFNDLAFYIWSFALVIAVGVTVRSLMHSDISISVLLVIALISLICCIAQFIAGRKIGGIYGDPIGGGQSLGQKNTGFSIWLSITFLTPVTSIAGGLYILWHNIFNSYQLYIKRKSV